MAQFKHTFPGNTFIRNYIWGPQTKFFTLGTNTLSVTIPDELTNRDGTATLETIAGNATFVDSRSEGDGFVSFLLNHDLSDSYETQGAFRFSQGNNVFVYLVSRAPDRAQPYTYDMDGINAWWNFWQPVDTTQPVVFELWDGVGTNPFADVSIESLTADRGTITIETDQTLDASSVPAASAFAVQVAGAARAVSSVSVSGTNVSLTLASDIGFGEAVTLAYTRPGASPIQSQNGLSFLQTFAARAVTNNTQDTTPPTVLTRNVNAASLVIECSENLNETSPANSVFDVRVGGVTRSISSISISGSTITVTLGTAVVTQDSITISYAIPTTNPIRDLAGNNLADFAATGVVNDTPLPTASAPSVTINPVADGDENTSATLGAALDGGVYDGAVQYRWSASVGVLNDPTAATPTWTRPASPEGDTNATIDLSVTVVGTGTIAFDGTGDSASATQINTVVNDVTPPTVNTSGVDGDQLRIICSEALDTGSRPAASAFSVLVAGSTRGVSSVAIAASTATLTLASAVTAGQAVTVAYTTPVTNPLRDTGENSLASFAAINVVNDTDLPDASAPTVSIDAVADGDENTTAQLTATINGGTYDHNVEYEWTVDEGELDNSSLASPTWTRPASPTGDTDATIGLSISVRGTGTTAKNGTSDTADATDITTTVNDVTAPTVVSLGVLNNILTIECSENLNTSRVPVTGRFTVIVAGTQRGVTGVAIATDTVTLTLTSAVVPDDTVALSYNPPAGSPIQDISGNELAAFSIAVTNNTLRPVAVAPSVSIDTVPAGDAGTSVQLTASTSGGTYDGAIEHQWTVSGGDLNDETAASPTWTRPPVDTGSANVNIDLRITVRGAGMAARSGTVANRSATRVTSRVDDVTAPTVIRRTVNATSMQIVCSEGLNTARRPGASAFTVQINGTSVTISTVAIAGRAVTLTLATGADFGDVVTVAYTQPAADNSKLQDTVGNFLGSFDAAAVTNNTPDDVPPTVIGYTVNGALLTIECSERLNIQRVPASSNFRVVSDGVSQGISTLGVFDVFIIINLAERVDPDAIVTVAYPVIPNNNSIQDRFGNNLAAFSAAAVVNNTLALLVRPVAVDVPALPLRSKISTFTENVDTFLAFLLTFRDYIDNHSTYAENRSISSQESAESESYLDIDFSEYSTNIIAYKQDGTGIEFVPPSDFQFASADAVRAGTDNSKILSPALTRTALNDRTDIVPWQQVSAKQISGANTIQFSGFNEREFAGYQIRFRNVRPSTDAQTLRIAASSDGGVTNTATRSNTRNFSTAPLPLVADIGTGTDETGFSGIMTIHNLHNVAGALFDLQGVVMDSSGNVDYVDVQGALQRQSTDDDINWIEFDVSAGNLASGEISLIGYKADVVDTSFRGLPNATAAQSASITGPAIVLDGGSAGYALSIQQGNGIYDRVSASWAVVTPSNNGGTITPSGDTLSATYAAPTSTSDVAITIQAVVTYSGTGVRAQAGSQQSVTVTRSFTVEPRLPTARAPSVTINAVPAGDEGILVQLSASIQGGDYDGSVMYDWSVGGGTLTDSMSASPGWIRPQVHSANSFITIDLTVSVRGTGRSARNGTSDSQAATQVRARVYNIVEGPDVSERYTAYRTVEGPFRSVEGPWDIYSRTGQRHRPGNEEPHNAEAYTYSPWAFSSENTTGAVPSNTFTRNEPAETDFVVQYQRREGPNQLLEGSPVRESYTATRSIEGPNVRQ